MRVFGIAIALVVAQLGCAEILVRSIPAPNFRMRVDHNAATKREQARVAFQQTLLAQAGALRVEAGVAASAGDCARVHAISQQIRYLPLTDFEGGYHDTVFLANPAIGRCLAKHRECLQLRLPECMPPAPVVVTRAQCVAARSEQFDRTLTEPFERRPGLLALLPSCALEVPADGNLEQAWQWTVLAATAGSLGECTAVIELDARVETLDREHYALMWSRDPSIARCKAELVTYRRERQRCLRERGEALRRAQTIGDTQQRGRALAAVPRCPVAR